VVTTASNLTFNSRQVHLDLLQSKTKDNPPGTPNGIAASIVAFLAVTLGRVYGRRPMRKNTSHRLSEFCLRGFCFKQCPTARTYDYGQIIGTAMREEHPTQVAARPGRQIM